MRKKIALLEATVTELRRQIEVFRGELSKRDVTLQQQAEEMNRLRRRQAAVNEVALHMARGVAEVIEVER